MGHGCKSRLASRTPEHAASPQKVENDMIRTLPASHEPRRIAKYKSTLLATTLLTALAAPALLVPGLAAADAGVSARQAQSATAEHSTGAAQWQEVGKAFLAAAQSQRQAQQIPSIALGLVDRSGLVWSGATGYADAAGKRAADAHTLYRIGSISKLFTDMLIMQLVEQGKLDLDAPVTRYLPDFTPHNPFGGAITLRQLTSHRSGLVREPPRGHYFDTSDVSLQQTVASLNSTTLVAAPGTFTKYSNAGIAVVGRVLEVVTGKPYDQLMQQSLLQPLGMTATALRASADVKARLAHAQMVPLDASRFTAPIFDLGMAPAGNLYSSVEDLAKFATAMLNDGTLHQHRVIQAATLHKMWQPQPTQEGGRRFGIGFGLGEIDGHRTVGHSGGIYGFTTHLVLFPDDGFGVIVMVALDDAGPAIQRLSQYAARQVLAARQGKPATAYVLSSAVPKETARKIAGHFTDGTHSLFIRTLEDRVYLEGPTVAAELRLREKHWVLDDVSTFRDDVDINAAADEVTLAGKKYRRSVQARPPQPAAELAGLIGEYGWDFNQLRIYERDGQLYSRIEWSSYSPLERVAKDVYRFTDPQSLYPREEIRFTRGANGQGRSISLNGIVFERHDFGAETEKLVKANVSSMKELRAEALKAQPPVEHGKVKGDLVELIKIDPGFHLDVRYASTNNFMGVPFYPSAQAFLQRPAAESLARAHHALAKYGYGIVVHDGYRPWYVTKMFWDATPPSGRDFVANPAEGSRHNRGCAADISMFELATGRIVTMPGRYDEMSARSSPLYTGGTSFERWQRDLLKQAVEAENFDVYLYEWWHFDYRGWNVYPIGNVDFPDIGRAN